jgi:UDP-N-acetyl-D-glucosamine dehydrogenase
VIRLLQQKGAKVSYHDPYIPHIRDEDWEIDSVTDLIPAVKDADCVVIVTNHKVYDYQAIHEHAQVIVDTRNALGKLGRTSARVVRL